MRKKFYQTKSVIQRDGVLFVMIMFMLLTIYIVIYKSNLKGKMYPMFATSDIWHAAKRSADDFNKSKSQNRTGLYNSVKHMDKSERESIIKEFQEQADHFSTTVENSFQSLPLRLSTRQRKKVLIWNVSKQSYNMVLEFILEDFIAEDKNVFVIDTPMCGYCVFTHARREALSSDTIVFLASEADRSDFPPPQMRQPKQFFVWWIQESPHTSRYSMGKLWGDMYDYYNATMTVRHSSDIYSPYSTFPFLLKMIWNKQKGNDFIKKVGTYKQVQFTTDKELASAVASLPTQSITTTAYLNIPETIPVEIHDLLRKKTRVAAWLVSNCLLTRRMNYYQELTYAGLKIDMLGDCGKSFEIESRWDPAFYEVLSRYKFYLAMENSYHCKDYFTEKVWLNALYSGSVPIILGPLKEDIAEVLPPKSYIYAEDFSSPKALFEYLQYLDKSVTAYAEYLEWRSWVKFLDKNGEYHSNTFQKNGKLSLDKLNILNRFAAPTAAGFCRLCQKIRGPDPISNIVYSPLEWFDEDNAPC